VSVLQPLPISGSSISQAAIVTCIDTPGHVKLVADSTTNATPDAFGVQIDDDTTGGEVFYASPDSFGSTHFEGTGTQLHGPTCMHIQVISRCFPNGCDTGEVGWLQSTQTFDYTLSLVP